MKDSITDYNIQDIINNNISSSNKLAFQMLVYFSYKNKKDINLKDLELFYDIDELTTLKEEEKNLLLQKVKDFKQSLKAETQAYEHWIKFNIQRNILKAKFHQKNLAKKQQKQIEIALRDSENKINDFDFSIFKLKNINSLLEFMEFLDSVEPIYLKQYKSEDSIFKDDKFLNKINETDFSLSNIDELINLFNEEKLLPLKDEIQDELSDELFKKVTKGFLNKKNEPDSLSSIFKKVGFMQLLAFRKTISLGV